MNNNGKKKYIKIFGAGSIGNHLANAAVSLGFYVDIFDKDIAALKRMKNEIYPKRYSSWNNKINLFQNEEVTSNNYELICIGTPPDTHIDLLFLSLQQNDCPIMVEKPLCQPMTSSLDKLKNLTQKQIEKIYVGYNHAISKACYELQKIVTDSKFGNILSLDVEFRENWKGIFDAHHWLSGPHESYLGDINSGGGSSGEHSHALNLWQHFCRVLNLGKTQKIFAKYDFVKDKNLNYDQKAYFLLETENKFKGSVVQDVVTYPPSKKIKIQGTNLYAEWICNYNDNNDLIFVIDKENNKNEILIEKKRPDDFIEELKHIFNSENNQTSSPLNLINGIETIKTLIAAKESAATGLEIYI